MKSTPQATPESGLIKACGNDATGRGTSFDARLKTFLDQRGEGDNEGITRTPAGRRPTPVGGKDHRPVSTARCYSARIPATSGIPDASTTDDHALPGAGDLRLSSVGTHPVSEPSCNRLSRENGELQPVQRLSMIQNRNDALRREMEIDVQNVVDRTIADIRRTQMDDKRRKVTVVVHDSSDEDDEGSVAGDDFPLF